MGFLEKELEDIIFETENNLLFERDLQDIHLARKKYRQVRIGNYGIADLVTLHYHSYNYILIKVWELKRSTVSYLDFLQLIRYAKGIDRYIKHREKERGRDYNIHFDIKMILMGKTIDTSSNFCYIPDLFDSVSFYEYKYNYNGIFFDLKGKTKLKEEF